MVMTTVEIRIGDDCDRKVSWFVYNAGSVVDGVAQASGDLQPGTEKNPCKLASNQSNEYRVNFTPPGGGGTLASGTVKVGQKISIHGSNGQYNTQDS